MCCTPDKGFDITSVILFFMFFFIFCQQRARAQTCKQLRIPCSCSLQGQCMMQIFRFSLSPDTHQRSDGFRLDVHSASLEVAMTASSRIWQCEQQRVLRSVSNPCLPTSRMKQDEWKFWILYTNSIQVLTWRKEVVLEGNIGHNGPLIPKSNFCGKIHVSVSACLPG